jgi:catechol 2,3-dioxygenase-like lactoylglutathione lyase family enzyme
MSEVILKSAVPILFVRDVSASAAFFREKLGFEIDFHYDRSIASAGHLPGN